MSNKNKETTKKILTTAELASANLRSDDSISFTSGGQLNPVRENNAHVAKIIATADGKVLIQPANNGSQIDLTQTALSDDQIYDVNDIPQLREILEKHYNLINERSTVKVNNVRADVKFESDPQIQINENKEATSRAQQTADDRSTVNVNNIRSDINFISDPQTQLINILNIANDRSTVRVGNARADINFTSDPQTQINNRLTAAQITPANTRIGNQDGGRVHFAGGLIIQWGHSSTQNTNFSHAFPTRCLAVIFAGFREASNNSPWGADISPQDVTRTGFRWRRQSGTSAMNRRRWYAIGY